MPDKEVEFVTGTVGGITQKGEQFVIEVTPEGAKYAKKCRTKSEPVRATAASLYGQVATFECGVSHGEYEGKPVRYFWINAVNPGSPPPSEPPGAEEALQGVAQEATGATESAQNAPEAPQATPAAQTRSGAFTEWDRQISIETQSALKCAVDYHAGKDATVETVVATATAFNAFLATKGLPF